jgi:hypothetical protein
MRATKQIALRRREMSPRTKSALILLAVLLLMSATPMVQAQRVALPPDEQEAVNKAIERGVQFLKRTQSKSGTWAKPGEKHPIGYAVLPALTLLECGVPANDPLIQKTALYLRARASRLDRTYELALGILFLDRLGEAKDKKLIQTFALRLIAGQSMTGGWGYKCPILGSSAEMELLTTLRHLAPPPPGMPFLAGDRPGMPAIAGNPGGVPDLAGGAARNPGDLAPIAQMPGGLPLGGLAALAGFPPLSGVTAGSGSDTPSLSGGTAGSGSDTSSRSTVALGESLTPSASPHAPPQRWRDCLGVSNVERIDPLPLDNEDDKKQVKKAAEEKPPDKPFVIPKRLRLLTVVQDPALHLLQDPKDKGDDLIVTTTDNSNTQFALLALWTAQRYEVPMNRTLMLVIRRYLTSQNADGSWGYHYQFGGGNWTRPETMTCVGLIGLAVAHGLAQPVPAGQVVRDPRLIGGLIALYKNVGYPVEGPTLLPMQNLYFLWSVERVAVLYNLPTLGDKDWYRWGAQVLVVNQQPKGNWANGGYPAAHLLPDTCLALLFLKRVNLAKDLAARLPFKAADLNDGIMDRGPPPSTPTPKAPETPEPPKKTIPSVDPPAVKPAEPNTLFATASSALDGTARASATDAEVGSENNNGGKKKWIVLSVVLAVILGGGSVFFFFVVAKRGREDKEEKHGKRKGSKSKARTVSRTV